MLLRNTLDLAAAQLSFDPCLCLELCSSAALNCFCFHKPRAYEPLLRLSPLPELHPLPFRHLLSIISSRKSLWIRCHSFAHLCSGTGNDLRHMNLFHLTAHSWKAGTGLRAWHTEYPQQVVVAPRTCPVTVEQSASSTPEMEGCYQGRIPTHRKPLLHYQPPLQSWH